MNRSVRCEHFQCGRGLAPDSGVSVDIAIGGKLPPTLTEFRLGDRHG